MEIDVIIPLYKPGKELFTLLDKLGSQSVPVHQVILLNTEEKYFDQLIYGIRFLETYQNIKVYHVSKREFDHGGTRRMGVKKSSADVFVMMTQDAMPKNGKLIETLRNAQGEKISVVFARQEPAKDCRIIERYTRTFNYPAESHSAMEKAAQTNNGIKSIFCSDVCAMYDRIAYEEVGGFPGKVIFNEDEIFAAKSLKAGYDIRYEAQAVVIHSHNYSGVQYFKRYFDLGVSQADFSYIFNEYHAEDEGIRLVKQTFRYLMKRKSYFDIPVLFYHSGMKLIGMKLGKMYRKLPDKIIMKCTSNKAYWKR